MSATSGFGTKYEVSWLWFAAVGLLVLSAASMAGSLTGPFIFDDIPLIQGNSRVHSLEHLGQLITGDLWDTNYTVAADERMRGFWRPVVHISYALNWVVGDGDPFWFHLTNLCLHAMNSSLVLFALRRWVGSDVAAVLGALVFALHPAQTETVAWIAGRTDSLCCLGLLLASLGLARRLRRKRGGVALEVIGSIVAVGSKESFVLLPVLLALEVWAHTGRKAPSRALLKVFLGAAAPHLVLVVLYVVLHQATMRVEPMAIGVTGSNRVPLFLEAWGRYTALILWPGDLTLGRALFSFSDAALVPVWHFVALGAVTLGLLVWSVTAWRRAGAVTVAWWSYAALLLPVSSIIWLDYDVLVSPRFLYIPMLAIAFMVAAGAARLRPWSKRWAQPLVILVVVVLGVRSFIRSYDFSSAQRFWRSEVTHNPRYTAAWAFFVARELKEGRPRGALNVAHAGFQALSSDQDIELARVGLIAPTLTAILSATPDLDRNTLRQVADFAKNVRELRPAQLNLPHLGLVLRLESSSVVGRALKGSRYRLLVLEADAHSRLGNRQRTRELLTPLLEECTKCWELFNAAMSIAARVDRLDLAATMVERARLVAPRNVAQEMREFLATAESLRARLAQQPGSKQRQVSYLAFIGAYARAYALARAEYERSPQPSLAKTVTELAVLAGDDQAAKQLLVQRFGPEKAPLYLQRLKELSGRSDPPAPAGHWTPKPQTLASATP